MDIIINENEISRIVLTYSDLLLRIAFQYTRKRESAEDCVQDCFLKLIKQKNFHSEEHLRAWLIRVTINRCKDEMKSSYHQKVSQLDKDYAAPSEDKEELKHELSRLAPLEQNVLYLYYYEDYTIK